MSPSNPVNDLSRLTLHESESDHTDSEGELRPLEVIDSNEDESGPELVMPESDNEYGIPDQWSVSRDHPFRKDYVWAPGDDEIYISSDESGSEEEEEEEGDEEDVCQCGNCPDQGVDGPRVCCARFALNDCSCITASPTLRHIFLHEGTMATLSITVDRHKTRPKKENTEEYNKLMRLTAYHLAKDELQLRGHPRTKLPDCLYFWVHQLFPSPSGNYVGFSN